MAFKYPLQPATLALILECCDRADAAAWPWRVVGDGPEATIRARIATVSAAVEAVRANAEAARLAINAAAGAGADDAKTSGASDLHGAVDRSETNKIAALETQLVDLDAALEFAQSQLQSVRNDASAIDEATLSAGAGTLFARLNAVFARIAALPSIPVEPSTIEWRSTPATPLGRIFAPRGMSVADIALPCEAMRSGVRPGGAMRLPVRLSAAFVDELRDAPSSGRLASGGGDHSAQLLLPLEESLAVVLPHLAASIHVRAVLRGPTDDGALLLAVSASVDMDTRGILVSAAVPDSAEAGSFSVVLESVSIAGAALSGFPATVVVNEGVKAPWVLPVASETYVTPCVLPGGEVVAPARSGGVVVIDSEGRGARKLLSAPLEGLRPENVAIASAYEEASETLFLGTEASTKSQLIATDVLGSRVKWATPEGLLCDCCGVAVLPRHGIVVACSKNNRHTLHAFRISDGEHVGEATPPQYVTYLAADPVAGRVYASTGIGCDDYIQVFLWDAGSSSLVKEADLIVAGLVRNRRPMTVMPPVPGKRLHYLIVGTEDKEEIRVIALPEHRLVATVSLGLKVEGLAADPSGCALVVADSDQLHALEWPLKGLPPEALD